MLRLSFGAPLKVRLRLNKPENPIEEDVYLGEIPLMIGGGAFIVNGAERVLVNQLHRSPGIDFMEEVPAGFLYVDGIVGDVGHGVLRDRRVLGEEGVVVVVVTVDARTGEVVSGPEILTRGWVYAPEAEDLLEETRVVRRAHRTLIETGDGIAALRGAHEGDDRIHDDACDEYQAGTEPEERLPAACAAPAREPAPRASQRLPAAATAFLWSWSSTCLGLPPGWTARPMFCWTSSFTLSHAGSVVGASLALGSASR